MSRRYENMFEERIASGQFKVTKSGVVTKYWRKGSRGKLEKFAQPRRISSPDHHGNLYVQLNIDGSTRQIPIARIVWRHFKGEIPEGMRVYHKDGDRSNNSLSNLYIDA